MVSFVVLACARAKAPASPISLVLHREHVALAGSLQRDFTVSRGTSRTKQGLRMQEPLQAPQHVEDLASKTRVRRNVQIRNAGTIPGKVRNTIYKQYHDPDIGDLYSRLAQSGFCGVQQTITWTLQKLRRNAD